MDENFIRSIAFLHNAQLPTLALLFADTTGVHVTSYELSMVERDFKSPSGEKVLFRNLESATQALVAVPGTNMGVLACGLTVLAYIDADGEPRMTEVRKGSRGLGVVFTLISDSSNFTKVMVCAMDGNIHMISLRKASTKQSGVSKIVDLASICLGQLVIASCVSAMVFSHGL